MKESITDRSWKAAEEMGQKSQDPDSGIS